MKSTLTGNLQFIGLPHTETAKNMFPTFTYGTLISIGKLCDKNFIEIFDKDNKTIICNNGIFVMGDHKKNYVMW